MDLFEAIQNTAFPTFIRESPSLMAYTLALSLHAMGLAVVVGLSTVVALRVLGVASTIPLAPLERLFPVMYVGFWVNALSGLALLSANLTGMLANPPFSVKLVLIAGGLRLIPISSSRRAVMRRRPRRRSLWFRSSRGSVSSTSAAW